MEEDNSNIYLKQLKNLITDFIRGLPVKVYLFGSRAQGTSNKLSDIDIAILPLQQLPNDFMTNLKERIEESTIPYSVDVIDLSQVDDEFKRKILAKAIEWKD